MNDDEVILEVVIEMEKMYQIEELDWASAIGFSFIYELCHLKMVLSHYFIFLYWVYLFTLIYLVILLMEEEEVKYIIIIRFFLDHFLFKKYQHDFEVSILQLSIFLYSDHYFIILK